MFLVLYRWRVKPGKEEQFREAWRRGTRAITRRYGNFGSRLGRTADGHFVGAAEWPDEASWRKAFATGMAHDDTEAHAMLLDAVLGGGQPVLAMTVSDDLRTRPAQTGGARPQ